MSANDADNAKIGQMPWHHKKAHHKMNAMKDCPMTFDDIILAKRSLDQM